MLIPTNNFTIKKETAVPVKVFWLYQHARSMLLNEVGSSPYWPSEFLQNKVYPDVKLNYKATHENIGKRSLLMKNSSIKHFFSVFLNDFSFMKVRTMGHLSVCFVFGWNLWSIVVEETWIYNTINFTDLGTTNLPGLLAIVISHSDTRNWIQNAVIER